MLDTSAFNGRNKNCDEIPLKFFVLFSFSNEVETSTNDEVAPESGHSSSSNTPVQMDFVDANDLISFVGRKLTEDEKFSLLTSTLILPKGYKIEAIGGRRFQESWTEERPWLRYSVSEKKAFCLSCICFGIFDNSDPNLSPFVSTGFCNFLFFPACFAFREKAYC